MFATNFYAPIYLSRALVRHWLKLPASVSAESSESGLRDQKVDLGKKILFVSSISGIVAMTPQMQMSYNSSKAALTMAAKVSKDHTSLPSNSGLTLMVVLVAIW